MAMEVENQATSPAFDDFLQTGRTGRRNAMPDIHGQNAAISTADLPDSLQKLSCAGKHTLRMLNSDNFLGRLHKPSPE